MDTSIVTDLSCPVMRSERALIAAARTIGESVAGADGLLITVSKV